MNSQIASNFIKYFELLAAVTGLCCYSNRRHRVWLIFSLYLLALFAMESVGAWLGLQKRYTENTQLYKWLVIPSLFFMYHVVFYQLLPGKKYWVVIGGVIFFIAALLENILLSKQHYYSISLALTIGCVLILLNCFFYLADLVKSKELIFFYRRMDFWFCLGVGSFYTCCFPYLTFFNSLGYNQGDLAHAYRWVFIVLNYFMYLSFTVGFIWSKMKL